MSKKSRVSQSGLIFFFVIIGKTGNSRIRFRYFIFEISGKKTNYAVFLPSLPTEPLLLQLFYFEKELKFQNFAYLRGLQV